VTVTTAISLGDQEKLEALRRLDQFRQWHSLDEKRYCLVCGKLVTGRQIQVVGGTSGDGPLRLSCPTEGCSSIPMDWVLLTDEILRRVEKMATDERQASALKSTAVNVNGKTRHASQQHDNVMSRLLRFAFPFKRYS